MKNIARLFGKRNHLLCAMSLIAGNVFLMSACGGSPDEGPAFLEIRNIPIHMTGMRADVELFRTDDIDFNSPLATFSQLEIVDPGRDSQNLRQHNLIRPVQIPDVLRSTAVKIRFRVYDNDFDKHRLEGTSTRTMQSGTNTIRWGDITRTGEISLNITNITNPIVPRPGVSIPIASARAVIIIFEVGVFETTPYPEFPPFIALSKITNLNTGTVGFHIWDNYPNIGVTPYQFSHVATAFEGNGAINPQERLFLRGEYEIFMIVDTGATTDFIEYVGPTGPLNITFDQNNVGLNSFIHIGTSSTAHPVSLAHNAFDPGTELAQQFFEAVRQSRQVRGLQ